ncbi:hypothetical protein M5K25_014105 [Dendrobium thyrsiflorum]|uniref:Uncharacterized protein n=1 Tax=Dendrobium thyrsiflorum TaxID=117978 RepID=A0ABD0UUI3_DENTH
MTCIVVFRPKWFGQIDLRPLPGASPLGIALNSIVTLLLLPKQGGEALTDALFTNPVRQRTFDSFRFLLKPAENRSSFCFHPKPAENRFFSLKWTPPRPSKIRDDARRRRTEPLLGATFVNTLTNSPSQISSSLSQALPLFPSTLRQDTLNSKKNTPQDQIMATEVKLHPKQDNIRDGQSLLSEIKLKKPPAKRTQKAPGCQAWDRPRKPKLPTKPMSSKEPQLPTPALPLLFGETQNQGLPRLLSVPRNAQPDAGPPPSPALVEPKTSLLCLSPLSSAQPKNRRPRPTSPFLFARPRRSPAPRLLPCASLDKPRPPATSPRPVRLYSSRRLSDLDYSNKEYGSDGYISPGSLEICLNRHIRLVNIRSFLSTLYSLFRFGQVNVEFPLSFLFALLFRFGQASIESSHSLFRFGQVNVGFSFLPSMLLFRFGQADSWSFFLLLTHRFDLVSRHWQQLPTPALPLLFGETQNQGLPRLLSVPRNAQPDAGPPPSPALVEPETSLLCLSPLSSAQPKNRRPRPTSPFLFARPRRSPAPRLLPCASLDKPRPPATSPRPVRLYSSRRLSDLCGRTLYVPIPPAGSFRRPTAGKPRKDKGLRSGKPREGLDPDKASMNERDMADPAKKPRSTCRLTAIQAEKNAKEEKITSKEDFPRRATSEKQRRRRQEATPEPFSISRK